MFVRLDVDNTVLKYIAEQCTLHNANVLLRIIDLIIVYSMDN